MASKNDPAAERPLAILSAPGSRGDVNPMVAIGRRLKEHGFDCVISLAEPYAPLAAAQGLIPISLISHARFDELLGTPHVWKPLSGLRLILEGAAGEFLQPHLDVILKWKRPGRTLLVSHPLDFASRIHRDLDPDTPLVDIFLSPAMIRDPRSPPRLSPWWFEPRRPAWLVDWGYRLGDRWLLDRYLGPSVNQARQRLGLPSVRRILDRWWLSPDRILSLYPEWFGPTPPLGGGSWDACGFPLAVNLPPASDEPPSGLLAEPDENELRISAHLARQAGSSRSPILFTPGTAHRHARRFFELAVAVCRRLDRPAIFATSHAEHLPPDLPDPILPVGYISLDRVLPRCAAMVHHGGIGTTAQGLAAACPQVVLPMAFDQFHNGQRLKELGVGRSLPRPTLSRLTQALSELLQDPEVTAACRRQADRMTGPDGAETAVRQILDWLRRTRGP